MTPSPPEHTAGLGWRLLSAPASLLLIALLLSAPVRGQNPDIVLSTSSLSISEEGSGLFSVHLDERPAADVTVTLASDNTDVTLDTDSAQTGNQTTLTFTAISWAIPQTVTVSAAADTDSADDTAVITASSPDISESQTLAVKVNDARRIMVSPSVIEIREGDTFIRNNQLSAPITITLSHQPTSRFNVLLRDPADTPYLQVGPGGAGISQEVFTGKLQGSDDYGVVIQLTTQSSLSAKQDDNDIQDDLYTVLITVEDTGLGDGGYGGVTGSLAIRVLDDDPIEPVITVPSPPISVTESGATTFPIKLAANPLRATSVTLSANNPDITVSPSTVSFTGGNWNSDQTITLSAAQDADSLDETVTLTLTGERVRTPVTRTVALIDDDIGYTLAPTSLAIQENGSGTFTVVMQSAPPLARTLTLASDNTDVSLDKTSLSFTPDNWQTAQTVTVSAAEDPDGDDDTATISLSSNGVGVASLPVTVTDQVEYSLIVSDRTWQMTEQDAIDTAGEIDATVRLSHRPSDDIGLVFVNLSNDHANLSIGSGDAGSTLFFTADNWETPQAFPWSSTPMTYPDDGNSDDESITLTLSASLGGYDGISTTVALTVYDDDVARPTLPGAPVQVVEGASATFSIGLSSDPGAGGQAVTLRLPTDAGITLDTDANTAGNQTVLNFTGGAGGSWQRAQTVTVTAPQDADTSNETVRIGVSPRALGDGGDVVIVQVTDDDEALLRFDLSPRSLTLDEGASATFRVSLSAQPVRDTRVSLASDNADVTVDADANTAGDQAALTFTTANWQTPQTVTVRAGHDTDETDDAAAVTLSADGFEDASVAVAVTDDDDGRLERERKTVELLLAEAIGGILSSTQEAIGLRWDAERLGRSATLAGRAVALDRSALQDLAAGFASAAGSGSAQQDRFAGDRFGAERHSADWLGGVPLDAGRP
ncbi:MAG: hypothetical protein ISN29_00110, partial [Gammaproteobacteria bacterium AqS3]|nr:hypothetical protein [Gammaproteobacteria bacterium AqS3]